MDSFWNVLEISGKNLSGLSQTPGIESNQMTAIIFMATRWSSSGPEKQGPGQAVLTEGLWAWERQGQAWATSSTPPSHTWLASWSRAVDLISQTRIVLLPMAAVTNYHQLGSLKQHKQGCAPSRDSISLPCPISRAAFCAAVAPYSIFKARRLQLSHCHLLL